MDDEEILALYEWTPGDCFRCAHTGLDTMRIKEIPTPAGILYEVRACRACVLELEEERRVHAELAGDEYRPGGLAS